MSKTFRRVAAFFFDLLAIFFLSQVLSMSFLNPNYESSLEFSAEYREKLYELEEYIKEGDEEKQALAFDEFTDFYKNSILKTSKLNVYSDSISILLIIVYFVFLVHFFDGQTIGKKFMRLKVVDKSGVPANRWQLFLRTITIYSVPFTLINTMSAFAFDKEIFVYIYSMLYLLSFGIELTLIITLVFTQDNRGIHDILSKTKVIEVERK